MILALAAIVACSPQTFSIRLEKRQKLSGIDVAGKSVSVFFTGADAEQSAVALSIAEGFASSLEADYFGGEKGIRIFAVDSIIPERQSILSLLMEGGTDVVFLFVPVIKQSEIVFREGKTGRSIPVELRLYAYDSLGEDSVKQFVGTTSFFEPDLEEGISEDGLKAAEGIGAAAAERFLSNWKMEQYSFYYVSSMRAAWDEATDAVSRLDWKEAVDKWMSLLDSKGAYVRSSLEYNIATALHLSGDNRLAIKWLELSEADATMALQPGLRKRIESEL